MKSDFAKFKKIDAHSHIGKFGSPFDVDFDAAMLKDQMAEYNIEKTILCPAAAGVPGVRGIVMLAPCDIGTMYRQMPKEKMKVFMVENGLKVLRTDGFEAVYADLG